MLLRGPKNLPAMLQQLDIVWNRPRQISSPARVPDTNVAHQS
jgi:hypothetical protein